VLDALTIMPKERPLGDLTVMLREWSAGNADALERLVPLVDGELRRIARRYLRQKGRTLTLDSTTALINETYACFLRQQSIQFENRSHFFGICAKLMRQILVGHARRRCARKRGGDQKACPYDGSVHATATERLGAAELLAVHDALERLAELDPRQARVVELRFFGGLTIDEASQVLGVSFNTVKRDWRNARLWLRREILGGENDES